MKKNTILLLMTFLIFSGFPAFAQKYKTAADTVKLNKELVATSNEVAALTAKLAIAQNNLPGYNSKTKEATSTAENSARESSDQAYKATNGNLGDAKNAKKKAKKALNDAEDVADAKNDVKDQEKKIDKLTEDLQKKQQKLHELEDMRTAIRQMHL